MSSRSTYERHIRVSCQLLPEIYVRIRNAFWVCQRGKEREDYGNSSLNYSLKVLTWSELALLCVCMCVCV